jgi:hypothetical protein
VCSCWLVPSLRSYELWGGRHSTVKAANECVGLLGGRGGAAEELRWCGERLMGGGTGIRTLVGG